MLNWAEHEKKFYNLGASLIWIQLYCSFRPVICPSSMNFTVIPKTGARKSASYPLTKCGNILYIQTDSSDQTMQTQIGAVCSGPI